MDRLLWFNVKNVKNMLVSILKHILIGWLIIFSLETWNLFQLKEKFQQQKSKQNYLGMDNVHWTCTYPYNFCLHIFSCTFIQFWNWLAVALKKAKYCSVHTLSGLQLFWAVVLFQALLRFPFIFWMECNGDDWCFPLSPGHTPGWNMIFSTEKFNVKIHASGQSKSGSSETISNSNILLSVKVPKKESNSLISNDVKFLIAGRPAEVAGTRDRRSSIAEDLHR